MVFAVLLFQLIVYMGLMLMDDYAGSLVALILGSICLSVWLISHLVEWVQPSRVNKAYYRFMFTGWLAPGIALAAFFLLKGGFDWLPN